MAGYLNIDRRKPLSYLILQGTSRLTGLVACSFFTVFFFGEGIPEIKAGNLLMILPVMIWLFLVLLAYVLAWFFEITGGIIMILSTLGMGAFEFFAGGRHEFHGILIIILPFTIPGLMFLITGLMSKNQRKKTKLS